MLNVLNIFNPHIDPSNVGTIIIPILNLKELKLNKIK